MQRAAFVLSATAAGVAGVLAYHPAQVHSTIKTTTTTASNGSTQSNGSTRSSGTTQSSGSTTTKKTTTSSSGSTGTRSGTGQDVGFQYGDIQLKVTMSGGKVTDVQIVQLNMSDPKSQSIDSYAIPQLRQEAIAAGSAQIDGVSGASYTSQAYEQALQSAIDQAKA
jgi:uncharacterized protein with FMN-binding domain